MTWEWWLRRVGDQVSEGQGTEMWGAGRVENKAVARVMAEERAWSQRFGECGGVMGSQGVVRQMCKGCHEPQGCLVYGLP